MKKKLAILVSVAVSLIVPNSYESLLARIPKEFISANVENERSMCNYYENRKSGFSYQKKTEELLSSLVGYYDFNGYSACSKLLDSRMREEIRKAKYDVSCALPFDSVTVSIFKTDPLGWEFFYWCLFSGKSASFCLAEYKSKPLVIRLK